MAGCGCKKRNQEVQPVTTQNSTPVVTQPAAPSN